MTETASRPTADRDELATATGWRALAPESAREPEPAPVPEPEPDPELGRSRRT